MNSNCSVLLLLLLVVISTAQLDTQFEDAQIYWPSQFKRSSIPSAADGELFAFPGLRGLRGKRGPSYHKRVPMMSLKGLRGKRAQFDMEQFITSSEFFSSCAVVSVCSSSTSSFLV